ncbi:MAG: AtpZ/AtpI family protein [bacterium]
MAEKLPYRKIAVILNITTYLVGSIFGGLLIGILVDKLTHREPFFTLLFLIVGVIYGIYKTIMIGIMVRQ